MCHNCPRVHSDLCQLSEFLANTLFVTFVNWFGRILEMTYIVLRLTSTRREHRAVFTDLHRCLALAIKAPSSCSRVYIYYICIAVSGKQKYERRVRILVELKLKIDGNYVIVFTCSCLFATFSFAFHTAHCWYIRSDSCK
jgi:hypothetical protein